MNQTPTQSHPPVYHSLHYYQPSISTCAGACVFPSNKTINAIPLYFVSLLSIELHHCLQQSYSVLSLLQWYPIVSISHIYLTVIYRISLQFTSPIQPWSLINTISAISCMDDMLPWRIHQCGVDSVQPMCVWKWTWSLLSCYINPNYQSISQIINQ